MSTLDAVIDEPVTTAGFVQAAVAAAVAVAVGFFGWEPTEAQIVAVQAVQAFIIMVAAYIVRERVTPTERVALTTDDVYLIDLGKKEARGGAA